jgi:hypothetical protein
MNNAIAGAKRSGALVCFGYCPVDDIAVVEAARSEGWLEDYETMIKSLWNLDVFLGKAKDHVYNHYYLYDSAFHLNDKGRAYHTYKLYLEICSAIGRTDIKGFTSVGAVKGCIFEEGSTGAPLTGVSWLG